MRATVLCGAGDVRVVRELLLDVRADRGRTNEHEAIKVIVKP
jgi:hypothetical protein